MSFKLNIRGRDSFPLQPTANPANPLINGQEQVDLSGGLGDEATPDLAQHTISRLAGLAGPAIEKEALPYGLSDLCRGLAKAYDEHHFACGLCCAAGQGRGSRCIDGLRLWKNYQDEGRGCEQ